MVNAMTTADKIPIIDTNDIEQSAGCFAKIRTPIPKIVVITDKIIEVLCVANAFSPVLYSFSQPLVIKILQSIPNPKINVEIIILKILNSI